MQTGSELKSAGQKKKGILTVVVVGSLFLLGAALWFPYASKPKAVPVTPTPTAVTHPVVDIRWTWGELSDTDAAGYLGDEACTPCHAAIVKKDHATHHAHTLRQVTVQEDGAYFRNSPTLTDPQRNITYSTAVEEGKCIMHAAGPGGKGQIEARWAVGSGKNGHSFLSPITGKGAIILRTTYYTIPRHFAFTPGQQPGTDVPTALGIPKNHDGLANCLSCHATILRAGYGMPDMARSQLGVGCERCHGPGRAHVEFYSHKSDPVATDKTADKTMEDLKQVSPRYINKLCGACHRDEDNAHPGDPAVESQLPRLQGAALARSACYLKSGALSCITCHDPHSDADSNPAHTDALCIKCHTASPTPTLATSAHGKICPVNAQSGCTNCHMPKQTIFDIPYTKYTNHWIKVWDKAKNR